MGARCPWHWRHRDVLGRNEETACGAVGHGSESDNDPLSISSYRKCGCAGEVKRRVALVGKGLTFDSGGYNLKVGGMIEMMKFDCGGAAAVLGAAEALAALKPPGVEARLPRVLCTLSLAYQRPVWATSKRGGAEASRHQCTPARVVKRTLNPIARLFRVPRDDGWARRTSTSDMIRVEDDRAQRCWSFGAAAGSGWGAAIARSSCAASGHGGFVVMPEALFESVLLLSIGQGRT